MARGEIIDYVVSTCRPYKGVQFFIYRRLSLSSSRVIGDNSNSVNLKAASAVHINNIMRFDV